MSDIRELVRNIWTGPEPFLARIDLDNRRNSRILLHSPWRVHDYAAEFLAENGRWKYFIRDEHVKDILNKLLEAGLEESIGAATLRAVRMALETRIMPNGVVRFAREKMKEVPDLLVTAREYECSERQVMGACLVAVPVRSGITGYRKISVGRAMVDIDRAAGRLARLVAEKL